MRRFAKLTCATRAGTDLTTLTKEHPSRPRVIAHVSSATRGALLVEPAAYGEFRQQAGLDDRGGEDSLYPAEPAGANAPRREVLRCPRPQPARLRVLRVAFEYANQERARDGSGEARAPAPGRRRTLFNEQDSGKGGGEVAHAHRQHSA